MRVKSPAFLFELFTLLDSHQQAESELVRVLLGQAGVKDDEIIVTERAGFIRVSVYRSKRSQAQKIQGRLRAVCHGRPRWRLRKFKNENWKIKTAKNFSIFALTPKFDIVPSWRKGSYRKTRRIPIVLDSINAFGTGLHETTCFMAQLIERLQGKFCSFLDIGTGTGLLAMIAFHCGATQILGIDVDRDAVRAARQNFRANGLAQTQIRYGHIESYRVRQTYDLVAANLITQDLIRYRPQILRTVKAGGYLAISGIMKENEGLIRRAFHGAQWRCQRVLRGEQWVAILLKKTR